MPDAAHCSSQPKETLRARLPPRMRAQGIQDGTLPADVDGATPDAAHRSSQAGAGGTAAASLDRLVLAQLVTVLQATSALGRGDPGGPARGAPGVAQQAGSGVRL